MYGRVPTGVSQLVDEQGRVTSWPKSCFQDSVKIVCQQACNGGWMSRLEQRVIPTLGPMIKKGWSTGLPPRTQQALAFWAVKTALVLDYVHAAVRVIPDAEYPALHAAQQPLPAHLVWIGRRNTVGEQLAASLKQAISEIQVPADDPDGIAVQIRASIAEGCGIYRVTFSVGHVVFQVFGHTLPGPLDIKTGPDNARILHQIWPPQGHITWPPERSIEVVGGVGGLHSLFGGPVPPNVPPPSLSVRPNRKARRAAAKRKKSPHRRSSPP